MYILRTYVVDALLDLHTYVRLLLVLRTDLRSIASGEDPVAMVGRASRSRRLTSFVRG